MKKKGFLVIQRGMSVIPIPPWYAPMKVIKYAKTKKEAMMLKKQMIKDAIVRNSRPIEIRKGYTYGKNKNLLIESFRFENVLTGKKWERKK